MLAFENIRTAYIEKFLPINIAFDVIFFLDIIVRSMLCKLGSDWDQTENRLSSAFYDDGVLVTEFAETRRNYLHRFVDFSSVLQ